MEDNTDNGNLLVMGIVEKTRAGIIIEGKLKDYRYLPEVYNVGKVLQIADGVARDQSFL